MVINSNLHSNCFAKQNSVSANLKGILCSDTLPVSRYLMDKFLQIESLCNSAKHFYRTLNAQEKDYRSAHASSIDNELIYHRNGRTAMST